MYVKASDVVSIGSMDAELTVPVTNSALNAHVTHHSTTQRLQAGKSCELWSTKQEGPHPALDVQLASPKLQRSKPVGKSAHGYVAPSNLLRTACSHH